MVKLIDQQFLLYGNAMRSEQQGFTLVELMIVVAIIGTLSALAIPAYQSYLIRAQISEGLNLVGPLKNAVTDYHEQNGVYPADNVAAAIAPPASYSGNYVAAMSIAGAVISIQYGNDANAIITGRTITLTASSNSGSMTWVCASGGAISTNYMPSVCR